MKEKIKKYNEKEIEPSEKVGFWKALKELLIQPDLGEEEDNTKAISQLPDYVVSSDLKKELCASLKNVDNIMELTNGGFSFKKRHGHDLRISEKENQKYLEKNPVHLDTKYYIDNQTGNIVKRNNTEISNESEEKTR